MRSRRLSDSPGFQIQPLVRHHNIKNTPCSPTQLPEAGNKQLLHFHQPESLATRNSQPTQPHISLSLDMYRASIYIDPHVRVHVCMALVLRERSICQSGPTA